MPGSSSLGFTGQNNVTVRSQTLAAQPSRSAPPLPVTLPQARSKMPLYVPKGVVAVSVYAAYFLYLPLAFYYMNCDYSSVAERTLAISAAGIAGTAIVLANDCVAWFNMVLFFHIGMEVQMLDLLGQYAKDGSDEDKVFAWSAFALIAVHLVPFLCVDHFGTLVSLAYVGLVVNVAAVVFVAPATFMIPIGLSSAALLVVSLLIGGIDCVNTSIGSQIASACRRGVFLTCKPFK